MHVGLRDGYTRAYMQIKQHTHMHKAVTGRVEAKKYLSCRRQSDYSKFNYLNILHVAKYSNLGFKEASHLNSLHDFLTVRTVKFS